MSQKKNTGRDFKIDLDDDNDDPDFQSEDEFENAMETVQSLTLADLLGQSQRRREENYRRQREQRRAETQKNTVTNAGDFFGFYFAFLLIVPKLWHHQSFHITGASASVAQLFSTKLFGRNMRNSLCTMQRNYVTVASKSKFWKKQDCGKRSKGARLDQIGKASPEKRGCLSRGPFQWRQI